MVTTQATDDRVIGVPGWRSFTPAALSVRALSMRAACSPSAGPRRLSGLLLVAGQPGRAGCRTEYSVPERKGTVIDAKPWRGSRT